VRASGFADGGQILGLSFSRVVTDVWGAGKFLKTWAALHRGEAPEHPNLGDRVGLETCIYGITPRLHADFALLHQAGGMPQSRPAGAASTVVSLHVGAGRIAKLVEELSTKCRKGRFIFNSETISSEEASVAFVVEALGSPVLGTMIADYRDVFAHEFGSHSHFGTCSAEVQFELPASAVEAAAALRKRSKALGHREFWAWKLKQEKRPTSGALAIESWLTAFDLGGLGFDGVARRVGLPCTFWLEQARARDSHGGGCLMLLPHEDGLQVAALLTADAAARFEKQHPCTTCHISAA